MVLTDQTGITINKISQCIDCTAQLNYLIINL